MRTSRKWSLEEQPERTTQLVRTFSRIPATVSHSFLKSAIRLRSNLLTVIANEVEGYGPSCLADLFPASEMNDLTAALADSDIKRRRRKLRRAAADVADELVTAAAEEDNSLALGYDQEDEASPCRPDDAPDPDDDHELAAFGPLDRYGLPNSQYICGDDYVDEGQLSVNNHPGIPQELTDLHSIANDRDPDEAHLLPWDASSHPLSRAPNQAVSTAQRSQNGQETVDPSTVTAVAPPSLARPMNNPAKWSLPGVSTPLDRATRYK
jgi:hypothetical protein